MVIMLNNNVKIFLVSFVHHIELQNFLNAPRMKCQGNVTAVCSDVSEDYWLMFIISRLAVLGVCN